MNLSVFYCKTNEMSSPDAKFFLHATKRHNGNLSHPYTVCEGRRGCDRLCGHSVHREPVRRRAAAFRRAALPAAAAQNRALAARRGARRALRALRAAAAHPRLSASAARPFAGAAACGRSLRAEAAGDAFKGGFPAAAFRRGALGASEPSAVSRHSARQRRRVLRHLRAASDRPDLRRLRRAVPVRPAFPEAGAGRAFFNRHGRFRWKTGRAFGKGRHRPDAARAVFGPAGHRRGARGGLRAAAARLRRPGRAAPRGAPADPLYVARRRRPAARLPPRTRRARR